MSAAQNFNYLIKFIIIGDSSVGKSNIVLKYANNKFSDDYQATIGVEFGSKTIEVKKKLFRIQIWDTAGQENFRSITRAYYKNCACAILTYDITNYKSFENIKTWLNEATNESPSTAIFMLIGNKCDLAAKRVVQRSEAENFAAENGLTFLETSAKTGEGIEEAFRRAAEIILDKIENDEYDLSSESCGVKIGKTTVISLGKKKTGEKKCC